ncbi:hypothetical protein FTV88_1946 [Heliorestis convoluta]|uniref:Uncharacterized protein n=1 Tax=Heliorestis convoluta TaxID=356322 RepID=A0A5Q2MYN0_9FIRM|nr:hypothetical protein FTV88_1946 [Heliorestis convoluta]
MRCPFYGSEDVKHNGSHFDGEGFKCNICKEDYIIDNGYGETASDKLLGSYSSKK